MSGTKKALVILGVIALVLVLGIGGVLATVRHSINSQITHIPDALPSSSTSTSASGQSDESGESEETGDPINFLVMGSDSRESGGDPTDWQYGAQRSDVLMVVQLSGDRKHVNVMSIPRDSWVDIPGHGTAKINAAFSWGGAQLTIQTVQQVTGIHIDHFAVVDFTSFEQMTDQLGGVTIDTSAGEQTMNGEQALKFVRERYTLPRGDFDRVRRQQAWIKAIMSKVFEKDVLTSPSQVTALTKILLEHSAVDESMNADSMISMALSMRNLRSGGVEFMTAPVTGTGTSSDGQSIVNLDTDLLKSLCEAWQKDDVQTFLDSHPEVQTLESAPVV